MMRRFGFVLVAFVVLASACSSGSDEETAAVETGANAVEASDSAAQTDETQSSETQSDETESDSSQTAAPAPADSDEPVMNAASPIGAFFAEDGGFEAALTEYRSRVEDVIVVCMAEQGFEFKRGTNAGANEAQQQQGELTERQWTSEYGYGLSTSFDSIVQSQASDPNAEIFFSLSAGERDIWAQTLAGPDGIAGVGGPSSRPLEEQGCIGQGIIETGGAEAIEGIDTFGSAYEEGEQALLDQKEMVDAVDAWSRCMSEGGHPGYSSLDDPEEAIGEKLEEITAPLSDALDELDADDGRALVDGDTVALENLPGLDVDALRALQDEEVTVALADLDCYDQEVRSIYQPLLEEFETGLLEDYSSEFEALRSIGQ